MAESDNANNGQKQRVGFQCSTVQDSIVEYRAVQRRAVQYRAVQNSTVQYIFIILSPRSPGITFVTAGEVSEKRKKGNIVAILAG